MCHIAGSLRSWGYMNMNIFIRKRYWEGCYFFKMSHDIDLPKLRIVCDRAVFNHNNFSKMTKLIFRDSYIELACSFKTSISDDWQCSGAVTMATY